MAEGYEENIVLLLRSASLTYLALRNAYQVLPLPIVLPMEHDASMGIEEFHRVMIEAAGRIADLPVDEIAAAVLYDATYHWISATAATRLYSMTKKPSYFMAASWGLEKAGDGAFLAEGMLTQD